MKEGSIEHESFAAGELCIVFDCHAVVCALPARLVDRLVLAEEAQLLEGAGANGKLGGKRVLLSAGQRFAAWDLGELVELAPLLAAWVLLRVPHRGGSVALALRTGRCRVVERLERTARLPRGVFRRRKAAFPACFARDSAVGLCLDPLALWSSEELEISVQTLASRAREEAAAP